MTYRRLIAFSLPSGIVSTKQTWPKNPGSVPHVADLSWPLKIQLEFPVFDQEVESHFGEVSRFPSLG
jgi:hypothetical protein